MATCSRCGESRESEFAPSRLKHGSNGNWRNVAWCRRCTREYYREHAKKKPGYKGHAIQRARAETRLAVQAIKVERGCAHCGERHPACLEFHHTDWTIKTDTVAKLVARAGKFETILAEINKCLVLCSNCHRKLHWEHGGNRNKKAVVLPLRPSRLAAKVANGEA